MHHWPKKSVLRTMPRCFASAVPVSSLNLCERPTFVLSCVTEDARNARSHRAGQMREQTDERKERGLDSAQVKRKSTDRRDLD